MGVYIKGMEMPKSCFYCPMRWKVDPDNIKCLATGEVFEETFTATIEMRNAGNCPLLPVPPHGRLIDADALKDVQQADADFFKGSSDYGEKCRYDEAINAVANIVNAPTIIPAEPCKEKGE